MSRRVIFTAFALCLALLAPSPTRAAAVTDSVSTVAAAHALLPDISAGVPGTLWSLFDNKMRAALKDSASWVATQQGMHGQLGALTRIKDESVMRGTGMWVWTARSVFAKAPVTIEILAAFTPEGRITGLLMRPARTEAPKLYPSPHLDYETKTSLHLPLRGTWDVFWGGRTLEQNYHAAFRDQRFAHDLLILKDGSSHKGDGKALTDYYAYGQSVLAPAAGKVVWLCDSLPDNVPGKMDPAHATGNSLVLDHGNGEFSLLAHLQPHSLKVKLGDMVRAGQVLGLCGNSGNTTEPHVHYHLQDSPRPFDGDGLPAQFVDLVVDGRPVARAEILKGQKVANAK